jgi:hypothetical protein
MTKGELRRQQASDLRAIMGHGGLMVAAPEDVPAELERDSRFDNEYGRLAERLYAGFTRMAEASGNERLRELAARPNVQNGAYLVTSLLRWGPKPYAVHLEETGGQPDDPVDDLGDIMRRSPDAVRTFADTESQANHMMEVNFGLLQHPPFVEPVPFVIGPADDGGEPVFGPSPRTLRYTQAQIMGRRLSGDMPHEPDPDARCPAVGRVLTAFWNAGIDECVADPALFRAGLAEAMAA